MDIYKLFCVCCCMSEKCLPDFAKEVSTVPVAMNPDIKLAEAIQTSHALIASTPVLSSTTNVPSVATPSPFESYASTIFRSKSVKLTDVTSVARPSNADLQEPQGNPGNVL